MTDTVNLGLPCIDAAQAQKSVTHNEALHLLDTLVQLAVLDRDLTAPPGSPSEGQRWIVKAGATGAWAGYDNQVAAWQDGGWQFSAPKMGWVAYVVDEGALVAWNGSAWVDALSMITALQNMTLLGVGTTADSTNPFSAKLNNALWTAKTVAEGGTGDLRYKMSKATAANTLSVLLQDNFSGRAEIGLTGDDDFHFKVSSDGSTWAEALTISSTTGGIRFLAVESDVASAATCDIGAATSLKVQITGTTTITSFGTALHCLRFLRFGGALTLTNNATSLILPTGANIVTAAGDCAIATSDASGNWRVREYQRADGSPLASSAGSGTVLYGSVQSLTESQAAQARANVHASPVEAMSALVLNPNSSMEVSQENGTSSVTLTGTGSRQTKYLVDGVMAAYRGTFVATAQQVTDAPPNFLNSVKFTVGTAESSLGANDELSVLIPVEGYSAGRLAFGTANASAIAVFFWVKAHRTGNYSGSLLNGARARAYPFSFTVNSADTWEYKSVLVSAGDTTGTWATDNTVGLYLNIAIAAGSSRVGTANTWAGSDFSGVTSTTNGVAATSDVFQITGVGSLPLIAGVSVGDIPSAAHSPFLVRPFDAALVAARRFWQKSWKYGTAVGTTFSQGVGDGNTVLASGSSGNVYWGGPIAPPMRAAATLNTYDAAGTSGKITNFTTAYNNNISAARAAGENAFSVIDTTTGTILVQFNYTLDARL